MMKELGLSEKIRILRASSTDRGWGEEVGSVLKLIGYAIRCITIVTMAKESGIVYMNLYCLVLGQLSD